MPDEIIDENDLNYGEEDFDGASPRKGGEPARLPEERERRAEGEHAGPRHRKALTVPGLPYFLPEAVLNPRAGNSQTSAPAAPQRDRDTLIITRSRRGKELLRGPASPVKGCKDFSSYYKEERKTYDKGYLNELAYMESMRGKMEERRKAQLQKEKAHAAAAKNRFMAGGRKGGGPSFGGSGGDDDAKPGDNLGAFFDRQEAMEKRRTEGRDEGALQYDYQLNPDKKVCPSCGGVQSYAEWRGGIKRCPKEVCGGAFYRPKLIWAEVAGSFLGRWEEFQQRQAANLEKLDAETMPPFRMTERVHFNKETNEMERVAVPTHRWVDVADGFFARNDEAVARIAAAVAAAEAERNRVAEKEKPKPKKAYKFSKPLPDFFTRQAAAAERLTLTFEDRLERMQDL